MKYIATYSFPIVFEGLSATIQENEIMRSVGEDEGEYNIQITLPSGEQKKVNVPKNAIWENRKQFTRIEEDENFWKEYFEKYRKLKDKKFIVEQLSHIKQYKDQEFLVIFDPIHKADLIVPTKILFSELSKSL